METDFLEYTQKRIDKLLLEVDILTRVKNDYLTYTEPKEMEPVKEPQKLRVGIPTEYKSTDIIENKILFALGQLERSPARGIANFLQSFEPETDFNLLFKRCTDISWKLYDQGILKITKDGKKNIYAIK